ncbi:hypothetical protein [Algoriphagus namhaensis]
MPTLPYSSCQFSFTKIGVYLISLFAGFGLLCLQTLSAQSAEPELNGPENLCIIFGGVIGTFDGGGDPSQDIYSWLVTKSTGEEIFNRTGGRLFDEIKVSFNEVGNYTVRLSVRRGTTNIYEESMTVEVTKGPELALLPDYLLCGESAVELTAISKDTPNLNEYTFIWKDAAGNVVGNENTFTTRREGRYFVELFLTSSGGVQSCQINGNTYVGPTLDFEVFASQSQICQGQSLTLNTDIPLSGEWFLLKPGQSQKESLGKSFSLELPASELTETGLYTAYFLTVDPDYPDCPSERSVTFEVTESPKVELQITNRPEDCSQPTGSFTVRAISALDSLVIPELGFVATSLSPGDVVPFGGLIPQIYTVASYSEGCEFTTLLILEAEDPPQSPSPPVQVQVDYDFGQETCSGFGVNPGWVNLTFPEGAVSGEYRILAQNSGTVTNSAFAAEDSLRIDLPDGTYFLELKIDGCTYPVEEFTIANQAQVAYSVPEQIAICESFDFVPETSQDLTFTLVYPDGSSVQNDSGAAFTLTQAGEYRIEGFGKGASTDCPKVSTFTATVSQAVQYEVALFSEDCFGNRVYEAVLANLAPDQASLRWLNEEGEIVGRGIQFYPTAIGKYSLLVQPLASGFCPVNPVEFEVEPPVFEVPVELEVNKICPEPGFSLIQLETDENEVTSVEWIYYDPQNQRSDLDQFKDLREIEVSEVGAYEAVVYNRLGCEIGRNFIEVEESTLLDQPQIDDRVGVCSKDNTIPPLDPGEYEKYEWYYGEDLVSTSPRFKPSEVGSYTLFVTTIDGCVFVKEFETYEVCDFEVIFPNAMVLEDINRDFRVRVSEGVTDAELLIMNRQGALIHQQSIEEINANEAILIWDGRADGRKVPLGTYVVILYLRNSEYGFDEKIVGSLLVLE